MACQEGHHEVVQTLLKAGADVNIAASDVSYTHTHTHTKEYSLILFFLLERKWFKCVFTDFQPLLFVFV